MKIFYNIKKIIFNKFFMEKENFKLRYFWKEWYDNEINAKDLAWSILALSELLNSLNEEFWSKNKKIELKIKWWEKWSFITDLVIVWTSFSWPILSIFQSWLWVKELLELTGLTWWAWLIWFLNKLWWEKPSDVKIIWDNATVVTWSWNTININANIYKAYQNNKNLENIKYLKEPLENENIDWLEVEYNWKKEILIDEKNKDFFDFAWIDENDIEIEETNVLLKISSINFGVWKKWKFKAMWIEFWALIVDEKFNKELSQKNFSSWDELFVRLETKKYWNKYLRKILEVIEHKKTPKQSELLKEQN